MTDNVLVVLRHVVITVPPATSPDSPSWMATPNPPSFTGAEFSLDASSTQWGWEREEKDEKIHDFMGRILLIKERHPPINNDITCARHTQTIKTITHHDHRHITDTDTGLASVSSAECLLGLVTIFIKFSYVMFLTKMFPTSHNRIKIKTAVVKRKMNQLAN